MTNSTLSSESNLVLSSISVQCGPTISAQAWADWAKIPHHKHPDKMIGGSLVSDLFGVETKSWGPEEFSDPTILTRVAQNALKKAGKSAADVDVCVVVTATPYRLHFELDEFELLGNLGLRDDVVPLRVNSGCSGFVRALAVLDKMKFKSALIVCYHIPSQYAGRETLFDIYKRNVFHPNSKMLWMGPAVFGDGAGAVVVDRDPEAKSQIRYSRKVEFADGITPDSIVTFDGGGGLVPPGSPEHDSLACFGLSRAGSYDVYLRNMKLNDRDLNAMDPDYRKNLKRVFIQQSNTKFVQGLNAALEYSSEMSPMNVNTHGNMSSVAALEMIQREFQLGKILRGDKLGFSVVGAGPDRGVAVVDCAFKN